MLTENELKHLSNILDISDVSCMSEAQVIYILAKRLAALELEVSLMKDQNNGKMGHR